MRSCRAVCRPPTISGRCGSANAHKTIAAWDGTSPATPTSNTNQTTTFTYNGNNNVITQTAVMPSGTNSQTTAYGYGVTIGTYNLIASNDLLRVIQYPDPSSGAASTSASNEFFTSYNQLGDKRYTTDQNGTNHQFLYDPLGRMTADQLLGGSAGTGVDTQTTARGFSYNDAGLPFQQTTYGGSSFTLTRTQLEDIYNGYGQLVTEYQSNYGAVNTSTTPYVEYGYAQPTGANYSRIVSMTYPNGRILDYGYNTGLDTTISRISYQADDGGSSAGVHLADYTYLGLSTIVQQANPEANTELTYIQVPGDTAYNSDGGDRYTGLDRFGRVIDQAYYVTTSPPSSPTFIDRLQYGYDRDSNVLYSDNLVNGSFSELYHANAASSGDNNSAYDDLNRITSFSRGTLTSSGDNGSSLDTITSGNLNSTTGVPNINSWSLDAIGNWNSSAPGGTSETNSFNSQNEETTSNGNSLTFDNNGNMTVDQNGLHYIYDAWNNLVQTYDSTDTTQLEIRYNDAKGRMDLYSAGSGFQNFYYSAQNQIIQLSFDTTYTQYVYGLGYVNDIILRDRNTHYGSGNLGKTGSGLDERIYVQQDANYDTISLLSQTGSTVDKRYVYDPYGSVTILSATWTADTDGGLYFFNLFQGGLQYGPGGLYTFGARLYSPVLGRWVQQDPAKYIDGSDLYQMEQDSPPASADPTGLAWRPTGRTRHTNSAFITQFKWVNDQAMRQETHDGKCYQVWYALQYSRTLEDFIFETEEIDDNVADAIGADMETAGGLAAGGGSVSGGIARAWPRTAGKMNPVGGLVTLIGIGTAGAGWVVQHVAGGSGATRWVPAPLLANGGHLQAVASDWFPTGARRESSRNKIADCPCKEPKQ